VRCVKVERHALAQAVRRNKRIAVVQQVHALAYGAAVEPELEEQREGAACKASPRLKNVQLFPSTATPPVHHPCMK
jgi:hypothetical protein